MQTGSLLTVAIVDDDSVDFKGVNVWHIAEFVTQNEPHDLPEFNDTKI